jgi:type I restriction enzyme, S subunit
MVKAGYKQTEVGEIPEDWETKEIRQVCKLINGRGFKPHEWKRSGLPIIRIQNLNGSDEFNYYDGLYDRKLEVNEGQLLFAWSGSRGTSFGPHVWKGDRGLLNYHTWKVVTDNDAISGEYFLYALRNLTASIEEKAHGASALVHTQKWEMEGYQFPAPKEPGEQKAIAAALSDVDTLIASLEKLIEKKRDIKTATMQQLLTGKKRLPGFGDGKGTKLSELGEIPEDWDIRSLGSVCSSIVDGTHYTPNYVENGVPFYSVENVSNDEFHYTKYVTLEEHVKLTKRCNPEKGDVLLTRIGTLGLTKFIDWDVEASIYVSLALIKFLSESDALFFNAYSKSANFVSEVKKRSLTNAIPQKINMDQISLIKIIYPTEKSERYEISEVFNSMEMDLHSTELRLRKTKAIKQGMMQELLTGRTRLV